MATTAAIKTVSIVMTLAVFFLISTQQVSAEQSTQTLATFDSDRLILGPESGSVFRFGTVSDDDSRSTPGSFSVEVTCDALGVDWVCLKCICDTMDVSTKSCTFDDVENLCSASATVESGNTGKARATALCIQVPLPAWPAD